MPDPDVSTKNYSERNFAEDVQSHLAKAIPDFQVKRGECLTYKVVVDVTGRQRPEDLMAPVRGQYAFETDILVSNARIPLVAIELKVGSFTTHDILTYSTKALKHKEIFPFLRYGLVVGGLRKIENRFFTHNVGFDFAFVFSDPALGFGELAKIVQRQIEMAIQLAKTLERNEFSRYETFVELS